MRRGTKKRDAFKIERERNEYFDIHLAALLENDKRVKPAQKNYFDIRGRNMHSGFFCRIVYTFSIPKLCDPRGNLRQYADCRADQE